MGHNSLGQVSFIQPHPSALTFCVEQWDDKGQTYETLAASSVVSLATAAYDAAVVRYPDAWILLRQKSRVIRDSREGKSGP